MACVKKACSSGDCNCVEDDGTNHFSESCVAMQGECPSEDLKCYPGQSTCKASNGVLQTVAWPDKTSKTPEVADVKADNKKYILHSKHDMKLKAALSYAHRMFAQGTVVTILLLSLTIALVNSKNFAVAKNTWHIIDFVVVTFIATSWFIVVLHSLDYFHLTGYNRVWVHMAVANTFLLISMLISYRLETSKDNLDVFNGIFTPMVMWCNAGFVQTVHQEFSQSSWHDVTIILVLMVYYAVLIFVFHTLLKKLTKQKQNDKEEEKVAGGALAGGLVLFCHSLIIGSQQSMGGAPVPTSFRTACMLNVFSVGVLVVSVFGLRYLAPIKASLLERSTMGNQAGVYWKLRACRIGRVILKHLPKFSFIVSIAHIIVDHMGYNKGSAGAQLLLACTSTVIGILIIYFCASVPALNRDSAVSKDTNSMLVGLGGFIVGAAWSSMLDNSVSMMIEGEDYKHPFIVKMAIISFITAFVVPVYCYYLKPMIRAGEGKAA